MTMNIPGRLSAPDAVLDPRIDDLLLRLRGLVLVGGVLEARGASTAEVEEHAREADRVLAGMDWAVGRNATGSPRSFTLAPGTPDLLGVAYLALAMLVSLRLPMRAWRKPIRPGLEARATSSTASMSSATRSESAMHRRTTTAPCRRSRMSIRRKTRSR